MVMYAEQQEASPDLPVDAVLAEVERFCADELASAVARHERVADCAQLDQLRTTVAGIGILPADAGEPSGLALWEAADSAEGRHLSLSILRLVAQRNMGFAWFLHQLALARLLERRLAVRAAPKPLAVLQGRYGLGRNALADRLCGRAPSAEDAEILLDYFDADRAPGLFVQTLGDWETLWLPQPDRTGALQWQCWPRDRLFVDVQLRPHGLDELAACSIMRTPGVEPSSTSALAAQDSQRLMIELLCLNALAQLAIGAGGVQHARDLAIDYARQRRQGGGVIARHPAIQLLLAASAEADVLGSAALRGLAALDPREPATLAQAFRARAALQPRFCQATSDALQVFGGMGYMQDSGMEKILRDQNTLRVIHGSPVELQLAATALEGGCP